VAPTNQENHVTLDQAKAKAQDNSNDGCTYHVCLTWRKVNGIPEVDVKGYFVSDWYDGTTVFTYSNGREV